jgi:phosphoglycolate phosphatase
VNILFDLDGTLTDPREGILQCLKYTLMSLGRACPLDAELERTIGPPLQETFGLLLGTGDRAQIEAAIALYRQRYNSKGIFENQVYPGIPSALARLQSLGAALYVATSKPCVFAERIVEHFGLKDFFRAVYGSELDGTRSDKRELIGHILEVEPISAASSFMVGDRALDVVGAMAHRILPVGALWGYGSRDELVAAGATVLCERPEMLADVLLENAAG